MTEVQLDLDEGRSYDVTLGEQLNHGGEGWVYDILGLDNYCAKIHRRSEARHRLEERLGVLTEFGRREWQIAGHPEITFPVGVCRDADGRCVGYAMRKLTWPPHSALSKTLQPSTGLRKNGLLTWEHCIHFAADLARVVGKLHDASVVVGDLCMDNVFVSLSNARITLLDVDSFQIHGPDGTLYTARVLRNDYAAPELTGQPAGSWRSHLTDLTSLGIVIAQILLDQVHPFSGYPRLQGPSEGDDLDAYCIATGLSWITQPALVDPPRNAPSADWFLPPSLLELMYRCFSIGATAPEQRPGGDEWYRELSALAAQLQMCSTNRRHRFRSGPDACPWRDRARIIGRDPFPQPTRPVPKLLSWLIEPKKLTARNASDQELAWTAIEEIKATDGVVSGKVIKEVKDGLPLDVGVRAFLPASQIELRHVQDLAAYVGQELQAKITDLDRRRNKLVLSRRPLLERQQNGMIGKLQRGQVLPGVVTSIAGFGAFVDIGGVEGLVHISQLSPSRVIDPSEVVEVGQKIEVKVLHVDPKRKSVSLSFKAAQEDRLRQFARMGGIGQILPATVISLLPGGAVVRLEDGLSGFVPTTELVEPGNVLEEVAPVGSEIFVKALAINMNTHKVSMSLRQADNEFEDSDEFADLALYGAHPQFDENDEYIWPEGWDPAESAWLSGFEAQREAWEQQYLKAQERREGHRRQVQRHAVRRVLPSDEVLAVLRAKLTGSR